MADKDKAGPSTSAGEGHIDFASLPPSALDSYVAFYNIAKGYPPPPSEPSPPAADEEEEEDVEGDEGRASRAGRRGSRVSLRNADEAATATTSSRLRPRSPSSSVAHLFPGSSASKRSAAAAGLDGATGEHGADGSGVAKDDEEPCPTHFFDVQEADEYLAHISSKHFAAQPQPKEGEVVVQFLYRCRAADKSLKVAS